MSATLKQLQGENIPDDYRDANHDMVFQVVSENGDEFFFVDELEAAAKVVELTSVTDDVR